jgi:hypothetical protein
MVNRGGVGKVVARGRTPIAALVLILGVFVLFKNDFSSNRAPSTSNTNQFQGMLTGLPLIFEPNRGQDDAQVKFLAHGSGYGLYLTENEAVLAFPGNARNGSARSAIRMQFTGAASKPEMQSSQPLPGRTNYLIGNDSSQWRRNIPQFGRVQYKSLYRGVDLDFYGRQGHLEYDFEVAPGVDPSAINLRFEGAQSVRVADNGDLILSSTAGELRFQKPHVYQKSSSKTEDVSGAFVLRADNTVGFDVGAYDRTRALVIDPVLSFSTLLGGSGSESCTALVGAAFVPHCPAVAVDSANRIYLAGATSAASGFPTPSSAPGSVGPKGGTSDVFVARISNSGSALALDLLTFFGGSGTDYPVGVAVDSGFNVYVAGNTASNDFPTTSTGFQTSVSTSAVNHAFVTLLDSSFSGALYSTYLAGSGIDTASDMTLDSQGRVYVFGTTTSSNFPITQNALQPAPAAQNQFFFSKLNTTLSAANSLLYSTYLGGSTPSGGQVMGGGIALDSNFNVYLAGGTTFTDMPVVNALQGNNAGGFDVWAAVLLAPANNTQQYTPLYETYFGGTGDDVAYAVAADSTHSNFYVAGSTTSGGITGPSTVTPLQANNAGGGDAFLARFVNPATTGTTQGSATLGYFTYLGGAQQDVALAMVADSNQNARIAGFTASGPLANPNPLFNSSGGGIDAFFARIVTTNTTSTTNTSSTSILGGSGTDRGTSVAIDALLNSYVAGETSSGNFPVASDPSVAAVTPLQSSLSGGSDAFVSKIGPNTNGLTFTCTGASCPGSNPTVNPSPVGVGNTVTFTYLIYNTGDPVAGVVFTDNIGVPANSTITSLSGTGCSGSGATAICNLGTVPTSTITTGTPPTISAAATVTVTVTATVPTASSTPTKPPSIGNSATLTVSGTNFQKTASGTASVNDYGIQATPNTQTIDAGDQSTYTLTVTPTGPYPESVSLACGSGLPSGSQCSFSSNNPISNLNNGPQSRTLKITTTARVTTPASLFRHNGWTYAFWLPVSGLALVGGSLSRRRRLVLMLLAAAVLATVSLQAGCSNSSNTSTTSGTPAGSYSITVNATSGSATRTTAVNLVVR